jgi:hypothetical protein
VADASASSSERRSGLEFSGLAWLGEHALALPLRENREENGELDDFSGAGRHPHTEYGTPNLSFQCFAVTS